jgi:hypothetical protein
MIALPLAAAGEVGTRVQIVAVIVTAIILGVVLELVRRRRLVERYALLWMLAAVALLVLAIWRGALSELAGLLGIQSGPNALFLVALGVTFVLLLHFSIAISRLSEEAKILAQEVARLDAEARAAREATANGDRGSPASEVRLGQEPSVDREAGSKASTSDQ